MENTKVVKPFIRRGWPNTFGNIVYICLHFKASYIWYILEFININNNDSHYFFYFFYSNDTMKHQTEKRKIQYCIFFLLLLIKDSKCIIIISNNMKSQDRKKLIQCCPLFLLLSLVFACSDNKNKWYEMYIIHYNCLKLYILL